MIKIEFILSLLVLACAGIMLVNVFVTPSPMKGVAIIVFSILFVGAVTLVGVIFKEMLKEIEKD